MGNRETYNVFVLVVRANVLGQMIAAHESFRALGTVESLVAGVGASMALQFIGACELLAAELPLAHVRPFAGVPAQMSA